MAESVVRFLVLKLGTLLENEVRQLTGVRDEVENVRDELELMQAFLREADAMEDADEALGAWVKQVRELAYDADDVIDHFLLRFEHPRRSGLFGRLSKIARVLKTLKTRQRVALELQKISSRAVNISDRRQRYIHNLSSTQSGGRNTRSLSVLRNNARLVPEAQLVGIERPKADLMSWLLADAEGNRSVRVMAVQGMGGLGKTTLVNQVYTDDQVKKHFQLRAWVTVSQSFDEHTVLLNVIKQLFKAIDQPIPEKSDSRDVYSLKEDIRLLLHEQKYLVVLDDVWNVGAWESLKYAFPDVNIGSCLIVTTRINDVAEKVSADIFEGIIYALKPLIPDESWNLFSGKVFHGKKCPDHLVEDSLIILKRCEGLPLAIVSIGGLLASKHASKEEWERVRRNLEVELCVNNQLSDMEKILSLSFNDLPYHLKSCILYLTVFSETIYFEKQFVIQLWIAEGFVQQIESATPEEVGDLFFSELVNRSLIQVAMKDDLGEDYFYFHVHDLFRKVLLRKSKNQNFATTINDQNLIVPERVRRLLVGTSLEKLEGECDFSRLRSLFFEHSKGSNNNSISMSKFLRDRGVRLLKVLNCSRLALETFPRFITTQYNLRYLNLSHTKLKSIPRSIGRLRKLETLNLTDTLIEELPKEILKIRGIRHLIACQKVSESSPSLLGVRVPTGIETLTSLQTLHILKVGQCGSDLIRSLGKLKQLRILGIQQLREEHGRVLCSSIEKMSHLRKLHIESTDDDEILDVQYMSAPPSSLTFLTVHGRLTKLPSWVSHKLERLVILSLSGCKITVDPLESLQALPSLVYLQFCDGAYDGDELSFRAGGFKMLKQLMFHTLGRLRRVTIEERSMPCLESLSWIGCKLLEEVPSGIEFLRDLQTLIFVDMDDQFFKRLHSRSQGSGFERIEHIPFFLGKFNADGKLEPYL